MIRTFVLTIVMLCAGFSISAFSLTVEEFENCPQKTEIIDKLIQLEDHLRPRIRESQVDQILGIMAEMGYFHKSCAEYDQYVTDQFDKIMRVIPKD